MKRWISVMALVLAAALPACQSTPESTEAPAAPASPATIQVQRFNAAETGERAPTPFRNTGDLYVLETGCDCILAITPAGQVSVAITTQQILDATGDLKVSMSGAGVAFDEAGTLYFSESESESVLKMERGGQLGVLVSGETLRALTGQPEVDLEGMALDSLGGLYVNDNESDSVLRIDVTTGAATILAGGAELGKLVGLETANLASSLVVGKGGVVFTTNEDDPQAVIGIGTEKGPGVFATSRLFDRLGGFMTVASGGDLVVMDSGSETVFRVSTSGDVTTFLSETQIQAPIAGEDGRYLGGIAFDGDDNLYITEGHENHILRFDSKFRGSIWVDRAAIQTATRTTPDLDGGIAFAPLLTGE